MSHVILNLPPPQELRKTGLENLFTDLFILFFRKIPFHSQSPLSLSSLSLTQELRKTGLENLFAADHMKNTQGEEVIERKFFVEERERESVCVCVR